jgi:hypothetical protein
MGYRVDGPGSSPGRSKIFLFFTASRPALGPTQPHIQWVPGALSPGQEADHSPPSSAEVKNDGAIPPLPHMSSWCGAWCCPRLATVARGVFPCPRLATNASADSRLRLQLCRVCRLASAQLTVFPNSVLCTQLTRNGARPSLYSLGSDLVENTSTEQTAKKTRLLPLLLV